MWRATCVFVLALAVTVSAAEFAIDRPDIVAARADGASVTLSLTPAKAAEWATWPKDGMHIRLVPRVPIKDVYVGGWSASTIVFRFPDSAIATAFAKSFMQGEKKP